MRESRRLAAFASLADGPRRGASSGTAPRRPGLRPVELLELQAALAAGASAGSALVAAAASDGVLAEVAREVRLGRPLPEVAATIRTADANADLLVRALALAERTGAGAASAVEQAVEAMRDEAALGRLLLVRTAQARGTAVVLTAVPLGTWLLLVALDGAALRFYATPAGLLTGALAMLLAAASWWCMRWLTAGSGKAAQAADPLTPRLPELDLRRGAVVGIVVAVTATVVAGVVIGAVLGASAATVAAAAEGWRRRSARSTPTWGGGAAEAVELVTVALRAGLPVPAALAAVAPLAPPIAVKPLSDAARRVANGWNVAAALAGSGLEPLGLALAASERWGAPVELALRRLAADLRSDRRAAVEAAAERLQLALVFPTTLLTLPAFVLAVVPPLLWTTLTR